MGTGLNFQWGEETGLPQEVVPEKKSLQFIIMVVFFLIMFFAIYKFVIKK